MFIKHKFHVLIPSFISLKAFGQNYFTIKSNNYGEYLSFSIFQSNDNVVAKKLIIS